MYRIEGKFKTRWYATAEDAWEAYRRGSDRRELPLPLHCPGRVAGDGYVGNEIHGVRNGHGVVILVTRKG